MSIEKLELEAYPGRAALGHDAIRVDGQAFEVSTVALREDFGQRSLLLALDSLLGIDCDYETLIFPFDWAGKKRINSTELHFAEYSSPEAAKRGHKRIVSRLLKGETNFFKGWR